MPLGFPNYEQFALMVGRTPIGVNLHAVAPLKAATGCGGGSRVSNILRPICFKLTLIGRTPCPPHHQRKLFVIWKTKWHCASACQRPLAGVYVSFLEHDHTQLLVYDCRTALGWTSQSLIPLWHGERDSPLARLGRRKRRSWRGTGICYPSLKAVQ